MEGRRKEDKLRRALLGREKKAPREADGREKGESGEEEEESRTGIQPSKADGRVHKPRKRRKRVKARVDSSS